MQKGKKQFLRNKIQVVYLNNTKKTQPQNHKLKKATYLLHKVSGRTPEFCSVVENMYYVYIYNQ